MTLTLRAVSLNEHPLTQPITAHFDAEGGSIGRADHNTLALPSPERHVSRQQAEISHGAEGYAIRNIGSANPIVVRGQALARGESAALRHSDQVRIGGYLLEVVLRDGADPQADHVVRGRAAVDAATPGVMRRAPPTAAGALGDLGVPLSRDNPFASLLGAPAPAAAVAPPAAPDAFADPPPAAAGIPAASRAWAPPPAAPPPRLPDDFDPFAPPPVAAPAVAPAGATPLFEGLVPLGPSRSIDQAFGLDSAVRDPLADFMAELAPAPRVPTAAPLAAPRESAAAVSIDPLAALGFADAPVPNRAPTLPDHLSALHAAFEPPPVQPRPAPAAALPPVPAPVPASAAAGVDARALWSAFCEGAGIAFPPGQDATPEQMRMAGETLRAAVAGTLQLMAVRATAKHELRAEITVIQARHNNPLKFSPDACSALEQLLRPPLRGFLPGPSAMTDAMDDLIGHAIGTMAGTRAALQGVLDRFTPQQLEAKLAGTSMLDSVLPMNRKAKLWALYLQHYEAIRNEAHDDFHSLFGRAFLSAYESQLERLRQAQKSPAA